MSLLTLTHVAKRFGDTLVLDDASLLIGPDDAIGLVGANGAGKTTLLRLIVGELAPDDGTITRAPGCTLGYLPQALEPPPGQTVAQLISAARGDLLALEAELRSVEHALAAPNVDDLDALLARYTALSETFEARGGYALHESATVLAGLGLAGLDAHRTVASLSGGEKARLALAALLLQHPDLLLLDEPTNHLDFAALAWLEEFLANWRGARLLVSHDRRFLDRTVRTIVELDAHTHAPQVFAGNYTAYAQARAQQLARQAADYAAQQEEIRELRRIIRTKGRQVAHNRGPTDSDGFYYTFKSGRVDATVARNVHAAEEKLRRIEADPLPRPPRPLAVNTELDPAQFGSKTPLHADDITVRFGARTILQDVACSIGPRTRAVIVGPNGAGKSTLIKVLAGVLSPDAGRVRTAPGVLVGYLPQEQDLPDQAATVYDHYARGLAGDFETIKADLLATGLFAWPELLRPVAALSVGQQRKVQIARLLAQRANLLLLDEPTNHLSLDVLEQFEQALLEFQGPIVAVSHDRRFIERFGDEIWEISQGNLRKFLGWDAYAART